MTSFLRWLFDSHFQPHGHCYLWQPALIWLHAVSDGLIALAYYLIPAILLYFVRRRTDVPFRGIFVMFGAFIVACGTTHLMEVWTLWHGTYWLSGLTKAGTALVSLSTAAALVTLVPEALALPSAAQLRAANEALHAEVTERELAERRLRLVATVLRTVSESADVASGFRTALARICNETGWPVGEAWMPDAGGTRLTLVEGWGADERATTFLETARGMTFASGDSLPGGAWQTRAPVWSDDVAADPAFRRRAAAEDAGVHAAFSIPVILQGVVTAVLAFYTRDRRGEDVQLVALVSAVTVELGSVMQQRRTEEALHHSEGTLKNLFEYAPDAIVAVDRAGQIVQANLQVESMFGYDRDELRGRPIEVLLPERLRDQHRRHRAVFSTEPRRRPMGAGLRLFGLRKDGTEFPIDINLTPVEDRADGIVMAVARDMTERREAQRRFRRLLESAPDPMMLIASDGRIAIVNGHAERLFGYTRQELVQQPVTMIVPPPLHEDVERGIERFFQEPRMMRFGPDGGNEVYALHRSGREIPLQLILSPLETEVGVLAVVAMRDLTERREADRQREMLYEEIRTSRERLAVLSTRLLAAQETERRSIARGLHDEIGQALTAVSVNLQTLAGAPDAPDRVEIIEESIAVTQQTLRQVRDLSLDLRPSLLDDLGLGPALRWYLERSEQRLGCTITLDDDSSDTRYPAHIETTCFRIAQEAVTNVARHASAKRVHVLVRRTGTDLMLVVEDDGTGFDVDAARDRATRGQSLGLLGMEERATFAGGHIEIVSIGRAHV